LSPSQTEGFTGLYLPKNKVIKAAKDKAKAELLLSKRDATSIKEVRDLNSIDPTFQTLLIFAI